MRRIQPYGKFLITAFYSVQSLHDSLNFRGMKPVFIPAVWKLAIPPRVHVLLWLLSNNKLFVLF
uniref:Reverse transcriptase zinc-binding domain-containing protein n=1 Tax=Arundo donax TaxID=35708 RepID=A0A0A8YQI0_ARUDO